MQPRVLRVGRQGLFEGKQGMNKIHSLFSHNNSPVSDQKNRSVSAILKGSEPEENTSLIVGRQREVLAVWPTEETYVKTPEILGVKKRKVRYGIKKR